MTFDIDTYPTVAELKSQVEDVTGCGVEFIFDNLSGGVVGTQKTARGGATHHLVVVNKNHEDLRHAIASFQLRHILRRSQIKTTEKDLTTDKVGENEIIEMAKLEYSVEQAEGFANNVMGNIVTQLMTSIPGIMVHEEISRFQGELAMQHKRMMTLMGENNLTYINPPELPIPKKIYTWNKTLLGIDNFYYQKSTGEDHLFKPFKMMGFAKTIEDVISFIMSDESKDLDNRELIDICSQKIGIENCYRWIRA